MPGQSVKSIHLMDSTNLLIFRHSNTDKHINILCYFQGQMTFSDVTTYFGLAFGKILFWFVNTCWVC